MFCFLGLHHEGEIDGTTKARVSKELNKAFTNVRFVYLKNHGINRKLVIYFLFILLTSKLCLHFSFRLKVFSKVLNRYFTCRMLRSRATNAMSKSAMDIPEEIRKCIAKFSKV